MYVLICGTRETSYNEKAEKIIREFLNYYSPDEDIIVEGEASGIDTLSKEIGKSLGFTVRPMKADWKKYGSSAGPIRNREMVKVADVCLALPIKGSIGTLDTIFLCKKKGIKCEVHYLDDV